MPDENPDQKPPQRLQSLASRGGLASGRGGRFAPNAVGRRSKEDRENTAPAMKPQESEPDADKNKMDGRGRFERRRQRQMGTRAEAAGPLAAPIIAANARSGGSMGTMSDGSRMRTSIRVKQDPDAAMGMSTLNPGERIDMAATDRDGDAYFPVRMPREPSQKHGATVSTGTATASGTLPGQIVDTNSSAVQLEENIYYLIQMPELGLTLGKAPETSVLAQNPAVLKPQPVPAKSEPKIKSEDPDAELNTADVSMADATAEEVQIDDDKMEETLESAVGAAGLLGSLRTHASGKITLAIGDSVYELMAGSEGRCAEELFAVDDEGKQAYELGRIGKRLLTIPDFDSLHI